MPPEEVTMMIGHSRRVVIITGPDLLSLRRSGDSRSFFRSFLWILSNVDHNILPSSVSLDYSTPFEFHYKGTVERTHRYGESRPKVLHLLYAPVLFLLCPIHITDLPIYPISSTRCLFRPQQNYPNHVRMNNHYAQQQMPQMQMQQQQQQQQLHMNQMNMNLQQNVHPNIQGMAVQNANRMNQVMNRGMNGMNNNVVNNGMNGRSNGMNVPYVNQQVQGVQVNQVNAMNNMGALNGVNQMMQRNNSMQQMQGNLMQQMPMPARSTPMMFHSQSPQPNAMQQAQFKQQAMQQQQQQMRAQQMRAQQQQTHGNQRMNSHFATNRVPPMQQNAYSMQSNQTNQRNQMTMQSPVQTKAMAAPTMSAQTMPIRPPTKMTKPSKSQKAPKVQKAPKTVKGKTSKSGQSGQSGQSVKATVKVPNVHNVPKTSMSTSTKPHPAKPAKAPVTPSPEDKEGVTPTPGAVMKDTLKGATTHSVGPINGTNDMKFGLNRGGVRSKNVNEPKSNSSSSSSTESDSIKVNEPKSVTESVVKTIPSDDSRGDDSKNEDVQDIQVQPVQDEPAQDIQVHDDSKHDDEEKGVDSGDSGDSLGSEARRRIQREEDIALNPYERRIKSCVTFECHKPKQPGLRANVFVSKDCTRDLAKYIVHEEWGNDYGMLYKYLDYIFRCQIFEHAVKMITYHYPCSRQSLPSVFRMAPCSRQSLPWQRSRCKSSRISIKIYFLHFVNKYKLLCTL